MSKPLSPKEQKFADAILIGKSAGEADILAGYSARSSRTEGPKRLQKPAIAEYIAAQQKRMAKATLSRRERILAELDKMAFVNIDDLIVVDADGKPQVDFSRATPDVLAAVTSVQTKRRTSYGPKGDVLGIEDNAKFTLADKYRGLELLGKAEGLFTNDKVEVVVDVADRLLRARQRATLPSNEEPE